MVPQGHIVRLQAEVGLEFDPASHAEQDFSNPKSGLACGDTCGGTALPHVAPWGSSNHARVSYGRSVALTLR